MTLSPPSILSESAIAAPVVAEWRDDGMTVREEVVITHPTEGQVSIDAAGVFEDFVSVMEAKRTLNRELVEQCLRWLGMAHRIYAVFAPVKNWTPAKVALRNRLMKCGIGIIVSDGESHIQVAEATCNPDAKAGALIAAILHTPDCGPSAGSAGAQRMTDSRREWKDVIEYLKHQNVCAECRIPFSEIKRATRTRKTAAALRKAIDEGGLPLQYEGYPTSYFWYVQRKEEGR